LGKNVTNFKVGDVVGASPQRDFCQECEYCKQGNTNMCLKWVGLYGTHFGGYATHI